MFAFQTDVLAEFIPASLSYRIETNRRKRSSILSSGRWILVCADVYRTLRGAGAMAGRGTTVMEELDSLLKVIGAPAYFFDMATHKLLSVNQSFAEMMKYDEDELLKMTVGDLRPAEELPKLAKALSQSPPEGSVQWRYKTKHGEFLNVRLSYRNSLYFDKINGRRHDIRLVVISGWDQQPVKSSDELFG